MLGHFFKQLMIAHARIKMHRVIERVAHLQHDLAASREIICCAPLCTLSSMQIAVELRAVSIYKTTSIDPSI
jgi:hypothetical protein